MNGGEGNIHDVRAPLLSMGTRHFPPDCNLTTFNFRDLELHMPYGHSVRSRPNLDKPSYLPFLKIS